MKTFKEIVRIDEAKQNALVDSIKKGDEISKSDFVTYRNMLNSFAKVNKQFENVVGTAEIKRMLGDDIYNKFIEIKNIMLYKGLPSIATINVKKDS